MNEAELISIIIPVYNIEAYLPKCLETICHQTYRNLEIILIDDGSTDSSGRICDEFAKKDQRTVVIHQLNQRQWAARNAGLKVAKGDYIMFVDGDDYIHLDAVRVMYEAIIQDRPFDMAMINYTGTSHADEDIVSEAETQRIVLSAVDVVSRIPQFSSACCKLYRKLLLDDIWFRPYAMAEDYDFVLQVCKNVRNAVWINKAMYFYVSRPGSSVTTIGNDLIAHQCFKDILTSHLRSLPAHHPFRPYLIKDLYLHLIRWQIKTLAKDEGKAVRQAGRCIECTYRKEFWTASQFCLTEKVALTVNLRYPKFIKWFKRATGNSLSWHLIKKF